MNNGNLQICSSNSNNFSIKHEIIEIIKYSPNKEELFASTIDIFPFSLFLSLQYRVELRYKLYAISHYIDVIVYENNRNLSKLPTLPIAVLMLAPHFYNLVFQIANNLCIKCMY